MQEKKLNKGSKLDKGKRWVFYAAAIWKRPKIKAYSFPKEGPPCLVQLPFASLTALRPRKRPAMEDGHGTKPLASDKPRPRQTFFEKLKGFFFT